MYLVLFLFHVPSPFCKFQIISALLSKFRILILVIVNFERNAEIDLPAKYTERDDSQN